MSTNSLVVDELLRMNRRLKLLFTIKKYVSVFGTGETSPCYEMNETEQIFVKVYAEKYQYEKNYENYISRKLQIFISFAKLNKENPSRTMKLSSDALKIVETTFISDDGTLHLIYETTSEPILNTFDVTVQIDSVWRPNLFASLLDDYNMTDFELRCDDGAVRVHKAVLSASSSVLKSTLEGKWRKRTHGQVDVAGISAATLDHLKDYMYSDRLPDDGLEHLVVIASYYMMTDLEERCVDKLMNSLTAEKATQLLKLGVKHRLKILVLTILECVQNKLVIIKDMSPHLFCFSENTNDSLLNGENAQQSLQDVSHYGDCSEDDSYEKLDSDIK